MKRKIHTVEAPSPVGPYNQAVEVNGVLYASGQIPIDPQTDSVVSGGIKVQTQQVMQNLQAVLKEADLSWKDVCKCSIFLTNLSHFADVNDVYASYFTSGVAPARECVEVSALPKNALVEISLIASK